VTSFDDPNREAVGLEPIFTGAGDNVAGDVALTATGLDVGLVLSGGISNAGYGVDWGDGDSSSITTGSAGGGTSSHTYAADGTYTVTTSRTSDGASTSEDVTVTSAEGERER
jgi:hypothetical protein